MISGMMKLLKMSNATHTPTLILSDVILKSSLDQNLIGIHSKVFESTSGSVRMGVCVALLIED